MKKNDTYDFSQPTRQSYAAILIITYRLYRVIAQQLFPIIVIVLLQGKLAKSGWFIYPIIGIAVLGAIYSILAFFKYYFFLKPEKLVVRKGVFKRSLLEIPFDRIQSINFEQNLIHRLFKVVKLNMDTAGSATNELELYALDHDKAKQLSEHILNSRKSIKAGTLEKTAAGENESKPVFSLNLFQLLKVGVTENHIRSGGIIIFFFFYIYDSLEDIGVDLIEQGEQYMPLAKQLAQSLAIVVFFIIFFSVVAFMISLVRTFLRYYDLKMLRKSRGFVVTSGLLNKKERAARDIKIQVINSSQNLLQKLAGLYELVLKQASSAEVSDIKSIKVVGLSKNNVAEIEKYVLKSKYREMEELPVKGVNFYFLFRRLYYWSLLFIPLLALSLYFKRFDSLIYLGILFALAIFGSFLAYRKKKYAIGKSVMRIEGGVFGHSSNLMELFKIQSIRISESLFQRRRKLASIVFYTASGSVRIPDISKAEALNINNRLLDIVEKSRKTWM